MAFTPRFTAPVVLPTTRPPAAPIAAPQIAKTGTHIGHSPARAPRPSAPLLLRPTPDRSLRPWPPLPGPASRRRSGRTTTHRAAARPNRHRRDPETRAPPLRATVVPAFDSPVRTGGAWRGTPRTERPHAGPTGRRIRSHLSPHPGRSL